MKNNALKIDSRDNVAVATQPIASGNALIIDGVNVCKTIKDIRAGHKVALATIPSGGDVIRYGEVIVIATGDIARGGWVHVHNTKPVVL